LQKIAKTLEIICYQSLVNSKSLLPTAIALLANSKTLLPTAITLLPNRYQIAKLCYQIATK